MSLSERPARTLPGLPMLGLAVVLGLAAFGSLALAGASPVAAGFLFVLLGLAAILLRIASRAEVG